MPQTLLPLSIFNKLPMLTSYFQMLGKEGTLFKGALKAMNFIFIKV